jgi:uncharacterized membrane protein YwaF
MENLSHVDQVTHIQVHHTFTTHSSICAQNVISICVCFVERRGYSCLRCTVPSWIARKETAAKNDWFQSVTLGT